ncbi:MAG: four helix bundle protein [bacterium]|nr:four helix bundle protein [bacterium]
MAQLNFHNQKQVFNASQPIVISKTKEAYQLWLAIYKNFPKTERFGLGQKISSLFIETLELNFIALYLPPEQKIVMLGKTISRLDVLKFFIQIAWENKLIPTDKFVMLSQQLDEVGRMLGGWRRGLQSKTPAK